MDKKQLEKFKKTLEEQKEDLEQHLSKIAEKDPHIKGNWESDYPRFGDGTDPEGKAPEEAGDEVEEYTSRLPTEYVLEKKLQATNKALEKIKEGTYGKCENCEGDIPEERLEAIPEAETCLECE